MGNVVVFCEYSADALRGSALSAITCARQLAEKQGGQVVALLVGKDAAGATDAAKALAPKLSLIHI